MPEWKGNSAISGASPIAGSYHALFGIGGRETKGGFERKGSLEDKPWLQQYAAAPTLFDYETMGQIVDFLRNGPGIGELGQQARGMLTPELFQQQQAGLMQGLAGVPGSVAEGVETGFRTDMAPIREAALFKLKNETIPDIAEQLGIGGSASAWAGTHAGSQMETELGALQSKLDEAAAGRRAQMTALAPGLMGQFAGTPYEFAGNTAKLEQMLRSQEEAASPGGRLFQSYLTLSGLNPQMYQSEAGQWEATGAEKFGQALAGIGSLFTGMAELGPQY